MKVWKIISEPDVRPIFPPKVVIQIKALACELPSEKGFPLSRYSCHDIASIAVEQGIIAKISDTTVWRWLTEDAIKPWQFRSWIFPRDPNFIAKASPILDLYQNIWEGIPLAFNEFVISADEKTSIQARRRIHITTAANSGYPMRVEHEYERFGAFNYIAAWDVHRAKIFGRCEEKSNIKTFDLLVNDIMSQEPYASAKRVFWIVDNGSSHRGLASIDRIQNKWSNIVLLHLPIHASWLNQIEIYFSILQRKVLTPNYLNSKEDAKKIILDFQFKYELKAKPFDWKFTKNDLETLLKKLSMAKKNLNAA